jgi:hypothetical protein
VIDVVEWRQDPTDAKKGEAHIKLFPLSEDFWLRSGVNQPAQGSWGCPTWLRRQDSNAGKPPSLSSSERTRANESATLVPTRRIATEPKRSDPKVDCTNVPNLAFTVADVLALLHSAAKAGPQQRKAIRRALLAALSLLEDESR